MNVFLLRVISVTYILHFNILHYFLNVPVDTSVLGCFESSSSGIDLERTWLVYELYKENQIEGLESLQQTCLAFQAKRNTVECVTLLTGRSIMTSPTLTYRRI